MASISFASESLMDPYIVYKFKKIKSSYLSNAWSINFSNTFLQHAVATDFIEVLRVKMKCMGIYLYSAIHLKGNFDFVNCFEFSKHLNVPGDQCDIRFLLGLDFAVQWSVYMT